MTQGDLFILQFACTASNADQFQNRQLFKWTNFENIGSIRVEFCSFDCQADGEHSQRGDILCVFIILWHSGDSMVEISGIVMAQYHSMVPCCRTECSIYLPEWCWTEKNIYHCNGCTWRVTRWNVEQMLVLQGSYSVSPCDLFQCSLNRVQYGICLR